MRVRCSMFMGKYIVGYWLSEYSIIDVGERKINKRYNGYASRVVYLSVAIAGAFWSLRPFWLQRSVYVYRIIFLLENYEKIFLFSEAFLPGLVVALRGKVGWRFVVMAGLGWLVVKDTFRFLLVQSEWAREKRKKIFVLRKIETK